MGCSDRGDGGTGIRRDRDAWLPHRQAKGSACAEPFGVGDRTSLGQGWNNAPQPFSEFQAGGRMTDGDGLPFRRDVVIVAGR